ncbi:MAG: hypothetical protein RXP91_05760 [Nitrososphaeria archaeon]
MSGAGSSQRLAEITSDIWRRADLYVTAALYVAAAVVPVLIIPSVPMGGALVLPIFIGLAMALLHVRGHPNLAKFLLSYYMIFVALVQVLPLSMSPKVGGAFGPFEALLISLGFIFLPAVLSPFTGSAVAGGFLAGALMVDPRLLPVGFALLIAVSIYQRRLAGPAGAFLVALLMLQPFVVAASLANVDKAPLVFPSMSIGYVALSATAPTSAPTITHIVHGSLPNPIYLTAPSTSLSQLSYAIYGFEHYLGDAMTGGFRGLVGGFVDIVTYYAMQVLMAIVFAVVSMLSVEGTSLLESYFRSPERGGLGKHLVALEPLVFALVLSSLFIYFASQMGVPLGYTTALGFSAGFAPLALGSVAAGGAAVSAGEFYVYRRAEEILLREEIEGIATELRKLLEEARRDLGMIRESVRERAFPYDEPLAQIERDMAGVLSAVEEGGLENLRRLRAAAGELLRQAEQLRNRMIAEILDYARSAALRFNGVAERYAGLTGRSPPGTLPVDYYSVSDVAQAFRSAYGLYRRLSGDMLSIYASVAGALHRLFPGEVPPPEEAEPTESLDRLESMLNYWLVPLLEGRRELFESFRDRACSDLGVGCGIPIIEAPKLVEELQRWAEERARELEERRDAVLSLRSTLSEIVRLEHGYSSLIESEKVLPDIEGVIESLRGWSDGGSILAAAAAYRELVPRIERAIRDDRIRVSVLSNYRLLERLVIDAMDGRDELRPEDIPLSADAAAYLMRVIATLRPDEFAYEEKAMPFGEVRRSLRRRKRDAGDDQHRAEVRADRPAGAGAARVAPLGHRGARGWAVRRALRG